jgi:AraC family transcriptional regulator, L-rhamnose operon regulatory protein RhaS
MKTSVVDLQLQDTASVTTGLGLPLVRRAALVRSHSASRIGWHTHELYELLCLSEGATVYEFSDGRTIELSGGQFLVIPPGTVHRGLDDFRKPALLCGLMLDLTKSSSIRHTPFEASDLRWLKTEFDRISLQPGKMGKELRSRIALLPQKIEGFNHSDRPGVLLMRSLLCQIITELANHQTRQSGPEDHDFVKRAIAYMHEQLSEPTSIRDVAHRAGCSRARLFDVFKEKTGMTPNDYWQRIRMEEAYRRVTGGSDSFTKIAMDCGFSTSQYFCSVFRKYWGMSPTECRVKGARSVASVATDQST